MLPRNYVITVD